jgi:hypothetical protein
MPRKQDREQEIDYDSTPCDSCGVDCHISDPQVWRPGIIGEMPKDIPPEWQSPELCDECAEEFERDALERNDDNAGDELTPEEFALLVRWCKNQSRDDTPPWIREHGSEYDVPEVLEKHPLFTDSSWHNDVWPSFEVAEFVKRGDFTVQIQIRHPIKAVRDRGEMPDCQRFCVYAVDNTNSTELSNVELDDVNEAIALALKAADAIRSKGGKL